MKKFLVGLTSVLLLINGIGAIYGGWNLILSPSGSRLDMSVDMLQNTPFHNFLIPGIILFVANGLFSMFVLTALLLRQKNYPWLVVAQGVILSGWIVIQVIMLQSVHVLHIVFACIGVALIITGGMLQKYRHVKKTRHMHV